MSWKGWMAAGLAGAFLAAAGCAGNSESTRMGRRPGGLRALAKRNRTKPATPKVVSKPPADSKKPVEPKPVVTPKPGEAEKPKPDEPKQPVATPKPGEPVKPEQPKPDEPKKPDQPVATPKPGEPVKPEQPKPDEPKKPDQPVATPKAGEPQEPPNPDAPQEEPKEPETPELKTLVTPTVPVAPAAEGGQEEGPELPKEILDYKRQQGAAFLDFDWLEMHPRVGLAIFSEDYHIDPSPVVSILARVPMPWLTPGSDGEYFGAFADVTLLPQAERDLTPEPESPTGSPVFFSAGFDFTFLRNQSLYWMVRYGGQYATYGGITNLTEGFGHMAGMHLGIYMGAGITMTFGSDMAIGNAGDNILLNYLGMLIEF